MELVRPLLQASNLRLDSVNAISVSASLNFLEFPSDSGLLFEENMCFTF